MIPLIPYRRFYVDVPIEPHIVLERVAQRIQPREPTRNLYSLDSDVFEGDIMTDGFQLNRLTRGRNSFLPYVRGHVRATARGSRVAVTLMLHPATIGFLAAWCVVFGAISFVIVSEWRMGTGSAPLYPLAGIPLAYVVATLAFGLEAEKAEQFIRTTLSKTGSVT